ncbi:MAG: xanthine dehydrogenase family protein molybdopterin-binding subunit [Saprospiraceae bacterium]|nr:xanthine dehydrogenase family protein molybdopterin-binding subunit [Saprospiraceae bacterium]
MSDSKNKKGWSRRKFLVRSAVGTGVVLGTAYLTRPVQKRSLAQIANTIEPPYQGFTNDPTIWFEILADNSVLLYSPKVEMGQGIFTSLAQMAADELEVDIKRIKVLHAPSASGNMDFFSTGGSTSISSLWVPLRELGATMRQMIMEETARIWNIPSDQLTVSDGIISDGSRTITYGEVVAQTTEWKIPKTPKLKDISKYKYIGQPIPRVDLEDKVMGAPIFGMDATMPDMVFGAVVRPDTIGATLDHIDLGGVADMPGVIQIVQEPDFVGVVATSRMEAELAKEAIKVTWKAERNWQLSDIQEMVRVGKGTAVTVQKKGSPKRILDNEDDVLQSEYTSPAGAHAQLEPNGALAFVEEDRATIYMSTQVVRLSREEIAQRLGLKSKQVNIIPTFLGGGFGRRLYTPNAIQAAVLSKAVGKPVKCFFNRKEEFQNDLFRPPTHHIMRGKLDKQGNILAIEHHLSSGDVTYGSPLLPKAITSFVGSDAGAWRGGMIQYHGIPNHRAISWHVKLPFATNYWRSLGLLANTFAIESFMDELAEKAGKDPVQFRLAHIQDDKAGKRLKAVIERAALEANYSNEVMKGRAMGFAASTDVNTPCAQVAEVSMENGMIKVEKVTCVMDPGISVNPDQIRAQCEGSIIMGLSASLYEQMTVVDGQLQPTIYGPYRMALMRDTPKEINVVLLQNDDKPGAVGEPPLGPVGAAIANAIYRLTGTRARDMPIAMV